MKKSTEPKPQVKQLILNKNATYLNTFCKDECDMNEDPHTQFACYYTFYLFVVFSNTRSGVGVCQSHTQPQLRSWHIVHRGDMIN